MKIFLCLMCATLCVRLLVAEDVYLKDGSVFRNVKVIDTVGINVRCLKSPGLSFQLIPLTSIARVTHREYDKSIPTVFEDGTNPLVTVRTISGEVFDGFFNSSDSNFVVYSTSNGLRSVERLHILSVTTAAETRKQIDQARAFMIPEQYPFENLTLMAGASFPIGDFGSLSGRDAGAAKLGFSAGVDYTLPVGPSFRFVASLTAAKNSMDETVARIALHMPSYQTLDISSWYSILPMLGIGVSSSANSAGPSIFVFSQVGALVATSPEIRNTNGSQYVSSSSATAFAYCVGGGIHVNRRMRITARYAYSKPKYHGLAASSGGSAILDFEQPTSIVQVMVGTSF